MSLPRTPEEVQNLIKELKKLNEVDKKYNDAQIARAKELRAALRQNSDQLDEYVRLKQESESLAAEAERKAAKLRRESSDAEARDQERLAEYYKQRAKDYEETQDKLSELQMSGREEAEDLSRAIEESNRKINESEESLASERRRRALENKAAAADVRDFAVSAAKGAVGGLKTILNEAGPALTTLAIFKPELGPLKVLEAMETEFKSFDDSLRAVAKTTGFLGSDMKDAFIGAFDPTSVEGLTEAFNKADEPIGYTAAGLQDIGLKSKDVSAAMSVLIQNVATFRQQLSSSDKTTTKAMLNMVAGLKKMGVAEADSGKAIDQFVKALGATPRMAMKSTRSLLTLAESLNMSAGQAVKDFTSLMPDLATYGDDAVEVFARMAAQARATGIEVGKLNGFAKKLDTFKGAAEFAQRFNAQLGGMYVSGIELAKMDLPDKITAIQTAFAKSGKSFNEFGKFQKLATAAALGVESVEMAARLLNAKDDFEEANESIKTSAMSTGELRTKLRETMTQMELVTASVSRQGAGFAKFTARTRDLAEKGSKAIAKGFIQAKKETQDGEKAAIGMLLAFKGMQGTAGILATRLKTVADSLKTVAGAIGIGTGVIGFVGVDVYNKASEVDKRLMREAFENNDKEEALRIAKRVVRDDATLTEADIGRSAATDRATPEGGAEGLARIKDSIAISQAIRKANQDAIDRLVGAEETRRLENIEQLSDSMVEKMVAAGMARGDVIKIINELDGDTIGDATFENIKKRLVERLR